MKIRHIIFGAGLVLLAVTAGLIITQRANATGTSKNKKAIDFTLSGTSGKKVKLSDYRGKVVVIDVWATWCGYCVDEIPGLVKMQAEATAENKPLQIIGISVDHNKSLVKPFVTKHKINYPILYAESKAMKPFGDIYGYPTKFIINKDGEIVDKIIGAIEREALEKRLEKFLK